MDEVAVSNAIFLLRELCDKNGPPFHTLLQGTQYTEQYLRDDEVRISWEGYCKIMENVGRLWNDEELEEIGRNYIYSKPMKKFRTSFQMFLSPKDFYKWLYSPGSPGRQDFTCIYSTVTDLGGNRILGILQMEKGYKPCREFFFITKGVISEISTTVGYPSSKVEMNLVEDAAYYYITVPEGSKVLSLIRYMIKWPFNLWTAKKELRETLESLQKAYVEIVHAKNNLEVRVEERTAELKQAQKVRERIFANISHEFRTPLTLIQGPVESMLSEENREEVKGTYQMIVQNTQRLLTLVNQLLDLSKIESGEINKHREEIDIVNVVKTCASTFESLANQKKIEFNVAASENEIVGMFDRDCIEKILINLLSNAFKFTEPGGNINIIVSSSDDFARLTVTDTGIGIPADELDKIFHRFYQVEAANSSAQKGTGIGLAHTKELVELHKGVISVISEEGRGSTFTVLLPLGKVHDTHQLREPEEKTIDINKYPACEKSVSEKNGEEVKPDDLKPQLLIIEDNPDMRKYIRMHLDDKYTVTEAANGNEGISIAVDMIPDIVISDVMMPKINGYEVCRQLKEDERTSHIPVILLTAKASIESKLEGLETGADSYLTKPFNSRELLVRVKNLIEQRIKLRDKFSNQRYTKPESLSLPSIDIKFLNKIKEVIEKRLADEKFGVEDLAVEVGMSRSQLHRKLRGIINRSPGEFILTMRLELAAELIKLNTGSISEIAYSTGFNTPNYFAKSFRKKYGCSPTEFKEKSTVQIS